MHKETRNLLIGAIIVVILMALGTAFDSPLSRAVINQNSLFGTLFQDFGLFPVTLIPFLAAEIFAFKALKSQIERPMKIIIVTLSFLVAFFMISLMTRDTLTYFAQWINNVQTHQPIGVANNDGGSFAYSQSLKTIVEFVLFIIGTALSYFWLRNKSVQQLKYLVIVGIAGVAMVYISSTVCDIWKDAWGRARPYEIINHVAGSHFTPWYQLNGTTGHKSFPSGHSNIAWMLVWVTFFVDRSNIKLQKITLTLTVAFGVLMMVSRLIVGAHHLTDVTVGALITILTIVVFAKVLDYKFIEKL
ncbi:MAG: phosphatase PAP2 family protein [Lactobacillaceae bacterium]|jgi:membrane-associated phospholipid phosphatase|nr:phosphatase PAP2 family protein [Lactobacillaceae bacterium]